MNDVIILSGYQTPEPTILTPTIDPHNADYDPYFAVRRQMAREAFAKYKRGIVSKEFLLSYAKQIGVVFVESELER